MKLSRVQVTELQNRIKELDQALSYGESGEEEYHAMRALMAQIAK